MSSKKKVTYGDIFSNISPSDVYHEKKPLAKAFFTAQESARNVPHYPDIIFSPRAPYYAYGLVTPNFRCNVNTNTPFGDAFKAALILAQKEEISLQIHYSELFPSLLFTIVLNPDAGMVFHETKYGWTCHRT